MSEQHPEPQAPRDWTPLTALLERARAAGLRITIQNGGLVTHGSARAQPIADELIDRSDEILAMMADPTAGAPVDLVEQLGQVEPDPAAKPLSEADLRRAQFHASPEWRLMFAHVMKRAGGMCEGCLVNPATEVHNLECDESVRVMAFNLVALCNICHDALHADEDEEEGEAPTC